MTAYWADALGKRAETGCHRCSTQTDEGKEVDAAYDTCAGCIMHCKLDTTTPIDMVAVADLLNVVNEVLKNE